MEDDDDAPLYERDEDEPEPAVKAPSLHLGAVLASKDAAAKRKSAPKRRAAGAPAPETRSPVRQGGNVGGPRLGGNGSATDPAPTPAAPAGGVGDASSTRPRSRSRSPGAASSVKKTPRRGQLDAGLEHDPEMAKVNDRLGGNKQCLRALQIERHLRGEKLGVRMTAAPCNTSSGKWVMNVSYLLMLQKLALQLLQLCPEILICIGLCL